MKYEIRPLGDWLEPVTKSRTSPFRAGWAETMNLLTYEVDLLGGSLLVLQVDVREGDLRRDGMLRANAKVGFPGVRVSFESRHGPLTYATDRHDALSSGQLPGWQQNVRAIALALQALRAVDRYGVTRRGEQYTGWRALTSGIVTEPPMTADRAAAVLAEAAHLTAPAADILADADVYRAMLRAARAAAHPDRHGGDTAAWEPVEQARAVLDAHWGVT